MRFQPFSAGSHRYQCYPRTGAFKRESGAPQGKISNYTPNRPQKFDSWLSAPLTITAGRFRRLAREFYKKPIRAERLLRQKAISDTALAARLGIGGSDVS